MIVYENFSAQRSLLAKECAKALGLKEIPAALYAYAVNVSELPSRTDVDETVSPSIEESSLLSMGLVYSYNGTLTFVNSDGHTMVMPDSDILKEELSKCGYLICEYGESKPRLNNSDEDSYKAYAELEEYREKYTLPDHLVERVLKQESGTSVKRHSDKYAYDVFSSSYYRGGLCAGFYVSNAIPVLDLTSKNARKLIAIFYGSPRLTDPGEGVRTLEDYILHAAQNDVLNDRRYYADNGLFEVLSTNNMIQSENRKKAAAFKESLNSYDENSLGPPPSAKK